MRPRAQVWSEPGRTGPSRRTVLRAASLGAVGAALPLAGCSADAARGRTEIRWMANKPEVLDVFEQIAADFNASQDAIFVRHDGTQTSIVSQFVRGAPPDVATYNYNLEAASYVRRGVLLDLSDLPEAGTINPDYQSLVSQFAQYEDETSVLPWSVAAAGVLYNPRLFDDVGVAVPTTWSELQAACEAFQGAGVTPIYTTARDVWTITQGHWDYCTGGDVDVPAFYAALKEAGDSSSAPTFAGTMGEAAQKMVGLRTYFNPDWASRSYADGNLAMSRGDVAMYFQGPWALGEIAGQNPDLELGTFALPMTEDAGDRAARVNLDLATWVPEASPNRDAAITFLQHLMSPEVCTTYNEQNLGFSPLTGASGQPDPRVQGLQPYLDAGRIYQGAGTYIPPTIPLGNYLQSAFLDDAPDPLLRTLDDEWARLARRDVGPAQA